MISSTRHDVAPSRIICPGPGLVDHLLVELADAAAIGQVDSVETPVGDRAGVGDGKLASALAAPDRARGTVPGDPGPELGEALGGIAAVEHVEDVLELLARELAIGLGRVDQRQQVVERPFLVGDHRDDLLGEDIEGVGGHDRLLDQALAHSAGNDGRLEQIATELRDDPALRDRLQ